MPIIIYRRQNYANFDAAPQGFEKPEVLKKRFGGTYITVKEAGTMEIKGIGGVYSTYKTKTTKVQAPKSAGAVVSAKNTDRVEFGFEAALTSAKAAVAAEVRADASPQELLEAKNTAEQGVETSAIAAMMFMG